MEKVKMTPKLLKILRAYTKLFSKIEGKYYGAIGKLEKQMEKETGIKGIGFYFCDGEFSGIGIPDEPERMKLLHRTTLEK